MATGPYLDSDPDRLDRARQLGADPLEAGPAPPKAGSFPITVDASGTTAGLHSALNSTAPDGICTSTSVFLDDHPLPLFAMYSRCCTFHIGRAHARAAIPSVLDLVASGRFDPSVVTTCVGDWDRAVDLLAEPSMKVVLTRDL